ncbi:uncharacterized protein LOC141632964 [Silene latifolia]|uniref:uncharacterized protein LOC141632964 n=1 Tax=Silene latifolia TaxID=37657 RepID=UPI003D781AEA
MKGTNWCDYMATTDCSWSWKKIITIIQTFKQAYTNNRWLNLPHAYSIASGYDWLRVKRPMVPWRFICWNSLNLSKHSFIMWEFFHQKLPTKDRLIRMGLGIDQSCPICAALPETHMHLLCECEYSKACLSLLQNVTKLQRRFAGACHVALVYWIWRVRNESRLDLVVKSPAIIVQMVLTEIKSRFLKHNISILKSKDKIWFEGIGL